MSSTPINRIREFLERQRLGRAANDIREGTGVQNVSSCLHTLVKRGEVYKHRPHPDKPAQYWSLRNPYCPAAFRARTYGFKTKARFAEQVLTNRDICQAALRFVLEEQRTTRSALRNYIYGLSDYVRMRDAKDYVKSMLASQLIMPEPYGGRGIVPGPKLEAFLADKLSPSDLTDRQEYDGRIEHAPLLKEIREAVRTVWDEEGCRPVTIPEVVDRGLIDDDSRADQVGKKLYQALVHGNRAEFGLRYDSYLVVDNGGPNANWREKAINLDPMPDEPPPKQLQQLYDMIVDRQPLPVQDAYEELMDDGWEAPTQRQLTRRLKQWFPDVKARSRVPRGGGRVRHCYQIKR